MHTIHKGLSIYYVIQNGAGWGLPDLLQYNMWGGDVSRDPKFVLRNIWTAPNTNTMKKRLNVC